MSFKHSTQDDLSSRVASIVLAGGQGTRLFPLTQVRCKPSVSFGGRYRLIDIPISNSLNSGIDQIYVISQFFSTALQQHIIETYPIDYKRKTHIHLISPEETPIRKEWFKGTADAIRQNLEHFERSEAQYFLILAGDQLYNIDFAAMLHYAEETQADLVIAALPVQEKEAKRMGLLKIDPSNHVKEFIEKPSDPVTLKRFELGPKRYLGSMGIYIFKRKALFDLMKHEGDDFGKDLIPIQMKKAKTCAFLYDGYWEDIGTVSSFYEANLALTKRQNCLNTYDEHHPIFNHPQHLPSPLIKKTAVHNSIISQGAIIEAEEIIGSVIGVRVHVKQGTVIHHSIILGNLFYEPPQHQNPPLPDELIIGEHCRIEKAIIDEHAHIGNHVHLLNKEGLQTYDGNGVYIREGIIIVTSGTKLPDGFVL